VGVIHYGVFGEGMGHCSRALAVAPALLEAGHRVTFFSSGRAADVLTAAFPQCDCVRLPGHRFVYRNNRLDWRRTMAGYAGMLAWGPRAWQMCVRRMRAERPVAAISDYEPFVARASARMRVPLIALDHQQVVSEGNFDEETRRGLRLRRIRLSNRFTYCRPRLRIISSFYDPGLAERRGGGARVLVGPILRREVVEGTSRRGEHILVYQTSQTLGWLGDILAALPGEKRVYGSGLRSSGNVQVRPFDAAAFLDDLASCRFAVVNGGHTTISEALHLGKPLICLPIVGQAEQEINAAFVEKRGFGGSYRPAPGVVPNFGEFLADEHVMRARIVKDRLPPGNVAAVEAVLGVVRGREAGL